MINNIKQGYVSFEVAKLLKENGFNIPYYGYDKNGNLSPFNEGYKNIYSKIDYYYRPTCDVAIDWIYENFGIWIYCEIGENPRNFYPVITSPDRLKDHSFKYYPKFWFDSSFNAKNSGIEITFNNLNSIICGFRLDL